jgi:hypothetical protein
MSVGFNYCTLYSITVNLSIASDDNLDPELSGLPPHWAIQLTLWGIVVFGVQINRQDTRSAKENIRRLRRFHRFSKNKKRTRASKTHVSESVNGSQWTTRLS